MQELMIGDELEEEEPWGSIEGLQLWGATAVLQAQEWHDQICDL